jgi:hypothetical protein
MAAPRVRAGLARPNSPVLVSHGYFGDRSSGRVGALESSRRWISPFDVEGGITPRA